MIWNFWNLPGKVPLIRGLNTREPNYNYPLKSRLVTHCRSKLKLCHVIITISLWKQSFTLPLMTEVGMLGDWKLFNVPYATKKNTLLSIVKYIGNPIFLSKKEFGSVASEANWKWGGGGDYVDTELLSIFSCVAWSKNWTEDLLVFRF